MEKNFWKKLKPPILALAPMAGITDSAFRQICKKYGADVVYSEMASATALFFQPQKTLELLEFEKVERPYIVQLFGNNPEHFRRAAEIISQKIKPDGIDINFGCPAPKVFKIGSGCALMKDFETSRKIIEETLAGTKLPVSIKIRAGVKEYSAIDFIKYVKDLPFAAVMVHGRTYEGMFSSEPDFEMTEKIKHLIPEKVVLANGGINTPEDTKAIFEKHPSFDGIGIARGALGRPFLFRQIKDYLTYGGYSNSSLEEIKNLMLEQSEISWRHKGEVGIIEMRKHLAWYIKGFPGASEIRKELVQVKNPDEISKILEKILP